MVLDILLGSSIEEKNETSIGALLCEFLNIKNDRPEFKNRPILAILDFAKERNIACEIKESSEKTGAKKYIRVCLGGYNYELVFKGTYFFFFRKKWVLLPKKDPKTYPD